MVDLSTPEARAHHDLQRGRKYPYHGKPPKDWAEAAALGIIADLCDRSGIKHEMRAVGDDEGLSQEIVEAFAAIIRVAQSEEARRE
jgi:hypothetical protein